MPPIIGRRQETVMYMNRRVKKRDLLSIANYRLLQKVKQMIRSATTVGNRSRPRNVRSLQTKQHIGKALFCTQKPPKAEDPFTETTRHRRAHVHNIQHFFFSERKAGERKYCFARSCDDKVYLHPGTSETFEKKRNVKIIMLESEGARQLPKYDWSEHLVW